MSLRLSSSVRVPFLPVAKMSQMCRLLRRLERVVARRRCCSFLFLRRVVPSVVQVILRARRVVEPAWGGVLGRSCRMLVRRNLISQYHNITIFALCPQANFQYSVSSDVPYPRVFGILGYSVSSGVIRYYHKYHNFRTVSSGEFNSILYPLVFGILWCLVSSGVWYPLVFGILWFLRQYHKYHDSLGVLRRILIVFRILWYLVSSGIRYPQVFGILWFLRQYHKYHGNITISYGVLRRYSQLRYPRCFFVIQISISRKDAPIYVAGPVGAGDVSGGTSGESVV